ncbi:hypothetical protein D3C72_2204000 [compost metagenome]
MHICSDFPYLVTDICPCNPWYFQTPVLYSANGASSKSLYKLIESSFVLYLRLFWFPINKWVRVIYSRYHGDGGYGQSYGVSRHIAYSTSFNAPNIQHNRQCTLWT